MIELINAIQYLFLLIYFELFNISNAKKIDLLFDKGQSRIKSNIHDVSVANTDYINIKDLLSDLDNVFEKLSLLKPSKSYTQDLLSKFGPYVISSSNDFNNDKVQHDCLEGFKAYGLPTNLICFVKEQRLNEKTKNEISSANFYIASKYEQTQPFKRKLNKVIYQMTAIYYFNGKPVESIFDVEVDTNTGEVDAYPELMKKTINTKNKNNSSQTFTSHYWDYPNISLNTKKLSKNERRERLIHTFIQTYNIVMRRENGINIYVKNNNHRCTFTIPQFHWKLFFKDRIKVKTPKGYTKPIFHAVIAHKRITKKGESNVRTHYKGIREFFWEDYKINIVMPKKHGLAQASLDIPFFDNYKNTKNYTPITKDISNIANNAFEGYPVDNKLKKRLKNESTRNIQS